jgi:hypothetical protein
VGAAVIFARTNVALAATARRHECYAGGTTVVSSVDEDRSVWNGTYEVDVVIDAPPSKVWDQFLDVGSWVTSHTIEEVGEPRRSLGAITRVSPSEEAMRAISEATGEELPPAHHHYCKIIHFVPEQQYVLKTYSEQGGSYGLELTAYDDTRFTTVDGGKTKVTFNLFCEMKGDLVAKDPSAMSLEGSRLGMVENLNNLKRLVESGN